MPLDLEFAVEPYQSGLRVDAFLAQQLRNYSPWQFHRLASWKAVRIDHQPADLLRRLRPDNRVQVRLLEPPETLYDPEPFPLKIIYEDAWIVVVDKPPGIIAHPTGNMQCGTLCNFLQAHFDEQTPIAGLLRPGIVHRIDRETSGLMVVAKTHQAHRNLVDSFEHSRVSKTYLAIVEGVVEKQSGTIDLPIGQDHRASKVLMSTRAGTTNAKVAKTHWTLLRALNGYSVVEAKPVTGRNHQIRVHFAAIGHPLAGDEFYGPHGQFKEAGRESLEEGRRLTDVRCEITGLKRHALHAGRLEFSHPITGAWMKLASQLPADLLAAVLRIEEGNEESPSREV
ncbi:RluA family pseudouridine synthase [Rubinisphaera margarita]|uniref:RluA family pseudouridine synthase n=1 Tax=Rubinisphaera margarita TaxID=2909586 RepID=UPI001EE90085|nr:RluA family pseudouridine synthase [Rubinisphaera margarita]MCG6154549.1 RluA family pseudouridine synthase [Rubinisphaera margarita]